MESTRVQSAEGGGNEDKRTYTDWVGEMGMSNSYMYLISIILFFSYADMRQRSFPGYFYLEPCELGRLAAINCY